MLFRAIEGNECIKWRFGNGKIQTHKQQNIQVWEKDALATKSVVRKLLCSKDHYEAIAKNSQTPYFNTKQVCSEATEIFVVQCLYA